MIFNKKEPERIKIVARPVSTTAARMEGLVVDPEEVENRGRGKRGEIRSQRSRTKNLAVAGNKDKASKYFSALQIRFLTFG